MHVSIREETVMIPTYEAGVPCRHPMFFENRVYQGSSGRVYPYPIIETVGDTKTDKPYNAVFLENQYLKVMVLPSLGGRIQRIQNKTNGEDIVYYNEVIKPALVGLLGPWISGGIEFNWPQHHRPTTFMPVDYQLSSGNGYVSIRMSDIDRMYGTKAVTTITLYADKAYVEIEGQLYNPTPFPQTFLWWANPAIAVNDFTQSIFPPDVHAVMDHGKRDVSTFPIATGMYYKHDYSQGVDISRYKNIPVPTSYMAYHSDYDFVGSYDHRKKTGILHVADHHISPGKKQWTWGCGDFGKAWDRNLTDANGPYVELMTGVFTDNQPDFSYLESGEEKTFKQYFFPVDHTPHILNASKDLTLSVEEEDERTDTITVYSSGFSGTAHITIKGREISHIQEITLSPTQHIDLSIPHQTPLAINISTTDGSTLLSYIIADDVVSPTPTPAQPIGTPDTIPTIEELYLAAKHLEQYRHATYRSEPYYQEALKRDPHDYRCNCGYGELLLKRGLAQEAESYFRRAIQRVTKHNPNPQDSSAYTLLGLSLRFQGKDDAAFNAFYKAIWDGKQREQGFLQLALIEMKRKDWDSAAAFLEQALIHNAHNCTALGYLAITERKRGNWDRAKNLLHRLLQIDPFDMIANYELGHADEIGKNTYSLLCLAADYSDAGLQEEAINVLDACIDTKNPMPWYYRIAYTNDVSQVVHAASLEDSDYFPNTLSDLQILESVSELITKSSDPTVQQALWKVSYLLGCFWYDKRQYTQAKRSWQQANSLKPNHAKTLRCLALVFFNQDRDQNKAINAMEQAYQLSSDDGRLLFELDQLYKKCGIAPDTRKRSLDSNISVTLSRDDLTTEYVTLLNLLGEYRQALDIELTHSFHPWEGGEGKITTQYVFTRLALARQAMKDHDLEIAKKHLFATLHYPENLHEGKLEGNKDNETHYLLGCIYEEEGLMEEAATQWEAATLGLLTASGAMFYYDQSPHMLLYKGLALEKLNRRAEATACFEELTSYGKSHMDDHITVDYFAVSLPDLQVFTDDLDLRNRIHCRYLIGLGAFGNKQFNIAIESFTNVLSQDPAHWEALKHLHLAQHAQ